MSVLSKNYLTENNKQLYHRKEYYKIENYVKKFLDNDTFERFIVMLGLRG